MILLKKVYYKVTLDINVKCKNHREGKMKILVLILGIVVCCVTCTSKRLNRQVVVNNDQVFFDDWDASRSALDLALHRSRVEKKPLLLWMSAYGYSFDPILIKKINDIPWLKNYILDSMVDCRLMVDSKFKYRPIKSREMKALVPREMNFRYEGHVAEWIRQNYCDSLFGVMVVVDHEMNKYSCYRESRCFLKDSLAFLSFLQQAKRKYD